ncbi:MAG: ThiF family adenylyltransferase [Spirochaetes bacterium]|nr:ThiF family adenylyltransferase [Spirochaetota bacterium]
MSLREEQYDRYKRNIALGEVGVRGQKKLLSSKVCIIGAGGLGSSCALYLAAAGVGRLLIVDKDCVERSNLQRQILHRTGDIGRTKVESARREIEALNPDVELITREVRADISNIRDLVTGSDFVIDAADNFETKFLINDACVIEKIPFSHAGVAGFGGQALTYVPGHACYRCLFESPPPQEIGGGRQEAGILGSIAGILGAIQATEAVKFLLQTGGLLTNRLLLCDGLSLTFNEVEVSRNRQCPVCGEHPRITGFRDEG